MIQKILRIVLRYLSKPWYPFLVALLGALDVFVVVIPNDALLISAVFAQPKRWIIIAFIVTLGGVIGAAILCGLLYLDPEAIKAFLPHVFQSVLWSKIELFLQNWGPLAVFIGGIGPLPLAPFILIAAFSGMPVLALLGSLFVGRICKYLLFSWIASHTPSLLNKIWDLKLEMRELETVIEKSSTH